MRKIAVIDLGSNSVRMNIYHINIRGGYSLYEQVKEMVRLSEGMGEELVLRDIAINRTLEALKFFKTIIESNSVLQIHCLATAAVRLAKNKVYFLNRVQEEVGFEFKVLEGEEEAYLDYVASMNTIEKNKAFVVDIGGASTEIIKVEQRKLINAISLPIGSVNLSENFTSLNEAEEHIQSLFSELSWLKNDYPIIGLGGVIRTLGKIHQAEHNQEIEDLHHYEIRNHEAIALIKKIIRMDNRDLNKLEGLSKRRVDIIKKGLLPLKCLLSQSKNPLIICAYGLREGFLYRDILFKDKPPVVDSALEHSIENITKKYTLEKTHANHVRYFVSVLSSALEMDLSITKKEKQLLDIASRLHDIGMHVNYYNHHIHGMHLMLVERIAGLSYKDQLCVAFLIGNHRKLDLPSFFEVYRNYLGKDNVKRLKRLSIILKLAEQMDKGENGFIRTVEIIKDNNSYTLILNSDKNISTSVRSILQYKVLFKKYLGKELRIECRAMTSS